jgi:hypothetical protein
VGCSTNQHEVAKSWGDAVVVDRDHVAVADAGEDLRLASGALWLVELDHLDGDVAIERAVEGSVDGPGRAHADPSADLEATVDDPRIPGRRGGLEARHGARELGRWHGIASAVDCVEKVDHRGWCIPWEPLHIVCRAIRGACGALGW